jgi:hypothetical protein
MELIFEHMAPTWMIFAGLAVAVLTALLSLWLHLSFRPANLALLALRIAFLALLGWCLLLPSHQRTQTELIKPRFLVMLDTSASMDQAPPGLTTSRWAVAQGLLREPWTRRVAADCTLEVLSFDSELRAPVALDQAPGNAPKGTATALREALRKIAEKHKGQSIAGILLLSDGLDTRELHADWAKEPWPHPLYTVRLEPPDVWESEPDVRIVSADTPRRVVVGWDTKLTAVVAGQGIRGRPFDVRVLENGSLLESIPSQLPDEGGSREIAFRLPHPDVGNFTYVVTVPPLNGETRTNDNTFSVNVQVVDARNRLLYAESVPRWESKYLARELKANKNITPMMFIRGPDGKFLSYGERAGMTLDMTDEQLTLFKTVILGDLDAPMLGEARSAALLKFVENGGSLVLLGGPAAWGDTGFIATPLKALLPFSRPGNPPPIEGSFAVSLSDDGSAHAIFTANTNAWEGLPPVLSIFPAARPSAGAMTLVEAKTPAGAHPILISQKYGQGKVMVVLTDSLWRWQLNPGRTRPYAQFWSQLIEWLSPAETTLEKYELDLFADLGDLYLGQSIALKTRFSGQEKNPPADASIVCEIQTPENRRLQLATAKQEVSVSGRSYPGYGADFTPQTPGLYRATSRVEIEGRKIESAPYSFFVQAFTPENMPRSINLPVLQALAENSGGKFCEPSEVNKALSMLRVTARQESRVDFTTLWQRWWVIACLMAFLVLEWIIRKIRSMA